jgi:hypothetical protein
MDYNTMPNNIKNKVASFTASIFEKAFFAYFSDIKKNIVQFIESVPENVTKLYYAYAILIFLIALSVSGVVILTLGVVLIILTLADNSVNKVLLSGILFTIAGLFYFIGTLSVLKLIGGLIHSSLEKSTTKALKKVTK